MPTLAALIGLIALGGCGTPTGPLDDEEKIVRETLRFLASDGLPVCVDSRTEGRPLAIYRTMSEAPLETRRMLAWRPPSPLRPPFEPTTQAIYRDSLAQRAVRLREPAPATNGLPPLEQSRLDGIARTLGVQGRPVSVAIAPVWGGSKVTTRWWPLNRMAADCNPRFVITDPVRTRDVAFVTVAAGHWGTTYSLERRGEDWRLTSEWSRWLY